MKRQEIWNGVTLTSSQRETSQRQFQALLAGQSKSIPVRLVAPFLNEFFLELLHSLLGWCNLRQLSIQSIGSADIIFLESCTGILQQQKYETNHEIQSYLLGENNFEQQQHLIQPQQHLFQSLKSVDIEIHPYVMTNAASLAVMRFLSNLPRSVSSISIKCIFYDGQDSVSHFIIANLHKLPNRLKSLNLILDGLCNLEQLSMKLQELPQKLEAFSLSVLNTPHSHILTLYSALERLPQSVEYLSLALQELREVKGLCDNLKYLKQLRGFKLTYEKVFSSESDLEILSQGIAENLSQLEELTLDFSSDPFAQEAVNAVVLPLTDLKRLQYFSLALREFNLVEPFEAFMGMTKIENSTRVFFNKLTDLSLDFSQSQIHDKEFLEFFGSLAENSPNLKSLKISADSLTLTIEATNQLLNLLVQYDDNFTEVQTESKKRFMLPKDLKNLKLKILNDETYKTGELKIPEGLLSKLPSQLSGFSLKLNFKMSGELFKQMMVIYKQLEKVNLNMRDLTIQLNEYYLHLNIKNYKLNLTANCTVFINTKNMEKQFKQKLARILLVSTPPQFSLGTINTIPDLTSF